MDHLGRHHRKPGATHTQEVPITEYSVAFEFEHVNGGRHMTRFAFIGALLLTATSAFAQAPPPAEEVGIQYLALTAAPAKGGAKLTVTSPAFQNMGDIPFENTQYRDNKFPG